MVLDYTLDTQNTHAEQNKTQAMIRHLSIFALLLIALSTTTISMHAQTLAEARKLYDAGNFAEAKPVFQRLVKATPANANYNLWYGVCCLRTGQTAEAVTYLRNADKRRATGSKLYLGEALCDTYHYEEAITALETYIADQAKRKRTSAEAEALLEKSRTGLRMIRGVENVTVIDSIVVDKDKFLDAYHISRESGQLMSFAPFFGIAEKAATATDAEAVVPMQTSGIVADTTATATTADSKATAEPQQLFRGDRTVYRTELGNKIVYADQRADSTLAIFTAYSQDGGWSSPTPLPDNINAAAASTAYPYVMPDGAVTYFASTGNGSLGGFDIFVTRYNSNTGTYYDAENIGMPFNSTANDYMYVIDEFNNLGWFASDRNQPADKVCIYVFIPNATKQVYSYEDLGADKMASLAQLTSIRDTWKEQTDVDNALSRLAQAGIDDQRQADATSSDFTFVVDDSRTYHSLDDFRSAEARQAFGQYRQVADTYNNTVQRLSAMRDEYATADASHRQSMRQALLDMEKHEAEQYEAMRSAEKDVRRLETK